MKESQRLNTFVARVNRERRLQELRDKIFPFPKPFSEMNKDERTGAIRELQKHKLKGPQIAEFLGIKEKSLRNFCQYYDISLKELEQE